MKSVCYMLLCALTCILQGCSTSAPAPKLVAAGGSEATYTVYGMDCPGCHGGLEKNLEKIPGVIDAVANWKQQTVTLYLTEFGAVTDEQVRQAVQDSNFTLDEPSS